MNPSAAAKGKLAFTLVELLVMIAAVAVLWWLLVQPIYSPAKVNRAQLVVCLNNLRQVGLAVMLYHQEHSNQPPWDVALLERGSAADCFLKLSSYLPTPATFLCPTDEVRSAAPTNYSGFSNSNLSYFATPNTAFAQPASPAITVLAGDRHLAFHGQPVKPGWFSLTYPAAADSKQSVGVLLFTDGHAARTKAKELPDVLTKQALRATLLAIP